MLEPSKLLVFLLKYLLKYWSNSASFITKFSKLKNSLSFSLPNFVNSEPIELNLNSIFANKYNKVWYWLRNYNEFWEIMNSFISVFTLLQTFVYIQSNSKVFGLSVFRFNLFDKWQIGPLVLTKYLVNSNSHSNFEFEGKI
jgi:hypothetical protein